MKPTRVSSDRRTFLKTGGAVAAGLAGAGCGARAGSDDAGTAAFQSPHQAAMPTRNLGKTGYKVGIFTLGGQAALRAQQIRCCRADR